jgi:hypothetical protein
VPLDRAPMTAAERINSWVVNHAPRPLLVQAYELVVSFVLTLVAVTILGGRIEPASVHAQLPLWMVDAWAGGMLAGSLLTLAGLFVQRRAPRVEWSGQILLGTTLVLYSIAIGAEVGLHRGGVPIVTFATLGCLGGWRAWKISNQDLIEERLTREAAARLVTLHGGTPPDA